jgi:hypothetical protein
MRFVHQRMSDRNKPLSILNVEAKSVTAPARARTTETCFMLLQARSQPEAFGDFRRPV